MIPNQSDLNAAVAKVHRDFNALSGVVSISLKYYKGTKPVIVVKGNVPLRPATLPKFYRSFADAAVYPIPILWEAPAGSRASIPLPVSSAEEDVILNDAMWAGAPSVVDRPIKMWEPGSAPVVPILQPTPAAEEREHQFATSVRLPQFVTPNFWAKPFHEYGNVCCPFYETITPVFSFQVPSDYLLIVKGVSYEFSDLVLLDQFIIHMLRDGNELTRWYDMKASNDPDPAKQFAFAGHYRPFPVWARFTHDQWFTLAVTVRGPFPFTKTAIDSLGGCISVYPMGWLGSLYDNRDGGALPVDLGELNDIFLGEPNDDELP